MIRSTTGFGRQEEVLHGRRISVELKSVNHKFFECSCKTPRAYVLETGNITLSGTGAELASSDAVKKAYLGG